VGADVPALRPALEAVVKRLLASSEDGRAVTLDAIGEALGTEPVSGEEVDAMMSALEASGRAIRGPEGARGAEALRVILPAAKALAARLGRRPTLEEIAAETSLGVDDVRHALALGSVMGR
jgi:hypothetical protein